MPAFQAACRARLQQLIPPANPRPVRGFSQDDSRGGLLTSRRRRLTARGVPPVGAVPQGFAWGSVYGAVEPTTGDRCCRAWPSVNAEMCPRFVDACAPAFPDRLTRLLRDHRGAPTAPRRLLPTTVRLGFLPPDGPALHPRERGWRDLKAEVAWQPFADLKAQQDDLSPLRWADEAATLPSLTGSPALAEALHARWA